MKAYPMMLNVAGRAVVVVGAGGGGLRKGHSLREAGANVTLVAEAVAAEDAPKLDGVKVIREAYCGELLAGDVSESGVGLGFRQNWPNGAQPLRCVRRGLGFF